MAITNPKTNTFVWWEFFPLIIGFIGGIITFAIVSNHDGHVNGNEAIAFVVTLAWVVFWGLEGVWRLSRYE